MKNSETDSYPTLRLDNLIFQAIHTNTRTFVESIWPTSSCLGSLKKGENRRFDFSFVLYSLLPNGINEGFLFNKLQTIWCFKCQPTAQFLLVFRSTCVRAGGCVQGLHPRGCIQGVACRGLRPRVASRGLHLGGCVQGVASKGCIQGVASRGLRPGGCVQGITTRGLRPGGLRPILGCCGCQTVHTGTLQPSS